MHLDASAFLVAPAEFAGFQHGFDRAEKAVGVGVHDGVELLSLGLIDGTALQGLEIEADAGERSLQLVRDSVEEGVLTLVAANLADQKNGVEDDARDEDREQEDAEEVHRQPAAV